MNNSVNVATDIFILESAGVQSAVWCSMSVVFNLAAIHPCPLVCCMIITCFLCSGSLEDSQKQEEEEEMG